MTVSRENVVQCPLGMATLAPTPVRFEMLLNYFNGDWCYRRSLLRSLGDWQQVQGVGISLTLRVGIFANVVR